MKKLVAALMCLVMVLSLFSCRTSDQKGEEITVTTNDTPPSSNDIAMQMYEAAINDEICVFDEHMGEIKLKSLRFPSNDTSLDECKLLTKAILDMDQDGINEYVIKSPNNDHIILHYYNGKVYSYCFDINDFCNLSTDGTFYWNDSSVAGGWEGGLNKIIFDGETLNIKSIYSLKYSENSVINYYETDYYEYYVNGEAVTKSEYLDFHTHKTSMTFTPFELTCSYPITAEQAWNFANTYWNNADGSHEGAAGTLVVYKVVLLDTPNSDTNYYRIALQAEFFSNHDIRKDCNPPNEIRLYGQLFVNAFTGAVSPFIQEIENICSIEIVSLKYKATEVNELFVCKIENIDAFLEDFDDLLIFSHGSSPQRQPNPTPTAIKISFNNKDYEIITSNGTITDRSGTKNYDSFWNFGEEEFFELLAKYMGTEEIQLEYNFLDRETEVKSIEIVKNGEYTTNYWFPETHDVLCQIEDEAAFFEKFSKVDCFLNKGMPTKVRQNAKMIKITYNNGNYELIDVNGQSKRVDDNGFLGYDGYRYFDEVQFLELIEAYTN